MERRAKSNKAVIEKRLGSIQRKENMKTTITKMADSYTLNHTPFKIRIQVLVL